VDDQDEALRKARQFADSVFADALNTSAREFQDELRDVRENLAKRGLAQSGVMTREVARLHGKLIDNIVMARLNGLLEGYDLHGVPLDEQLAARTIDEVMNLKDAKLRDVGRSVTMIADRSVTPGVLEQLVQSECKVSRASVNVHVQRRRMTPKKAASTISVIYQLIGHGSRVNLNSTDSSTNVVEVSEEQIFAKTRQQIMTGIPGGEERDSILERLTALERDQHSTSFATRYAEFVNAAANHVTLLAPFLPALAAMVQPWR
jgi:hypothetical protein